MFSAIFNLIAGIAALLSCFASGDVTDAVNLCTVSGAAWSVSGILALL